MNFSFTLVVKSFGTEDRPTERPVPPKDEIYDFIIFRGSDIKGIDVLEPPKPTPTGSDGLPIDPAIVEVSHYVSISLHLLCLHLFGLNLFLHIEPSVKTTTSFKHRTCSCSGSSVTCLCSGGWEC